MSTHAIAVENVKSGAVTTDTTERSAVLAEGVRPGWLAGRCIAVAPYLHVDLYRNRNLVRRLSNF